MKSVGDILPSPALSNPSAGFKCWPCPCRHASSAWCDSESTTADRLGARARPRTASVREHDRLGARARPPRRESTTASVREHDRLGATERSAIQSYKSVVCVFVYFLLIEFINVYKRLLSLFTSSAAPTESVHKQRVYERFIYYRLQFEVCKHRSLESMAFAWGVRLP